MNRVLVKPKMAAPATQELAALPVRGAADFPMPLVTIYDLWLATWETALAALATATRSRALSANQAAAHTAVINTERELVTKHFTVLLGRELPRRRASDNGSIRSGEEPCDVR
ncbi:MAG TPA: hypothetical protein VFU51_08925 [Gaiellaceae bacterium]|nr:hypothetical protein [Gaiellaceae bacterium]